MAKPVAVCISDVHFTINTLELASAALTQALVKAKELKVPLIIAGDLTDGKAIIRGEVANRLIDLFESHSEVEVYLIIGNHDLLNEKGTAHALNYLWPYTKIVDGTQSYHVEDVGYLIPYQNSPEALQSILKTIPRGSTLIMHQGVQGAFMGHYTQDKTSLPPDTFKAHTVISGHYHQYQTVGAVTYIGSPYTITFAESHDGPKGFLVLNDDGSHSRVLTNLRKHIKVERTIGNLWDPIPELITGDLLWLQVHGPRSELSKIKKAALGEALVGHSNFKLDLIFNDVAQVEISNIEKYTKEELLDALIEQVDETDEQKVFLKGLWRELV